MLVTLRLELVDALNRTDTFDNFWREVLRLSDDEISDRNPRRMERAIRDHFGPVLTTLINRDGPLEKDRAIAKFWPRFSRGDIYFRVRYVTYRSLDIVLDVLGTSKDALTSGFLSALEYYAPLAFNDILGTSLDIHATAESMAPPLETNKKDVLANKVWYLANSTLLLPVGLALYVCYTVFNAMTHEADGLRTERIENMKAIVEQNGKISAVLIEQTKASISILKAFEESRKNVTKDSPSTSGSDMKAKDAEKSQP